MFILQFVSTIDGKTLVYVDGYTYENIAVLGHEIVRNHVQFQTTHRIEKATQFRRKTDAGRALERIRKSARYREFTQVTIRSVKHRLEVIPFFPDIHAVMNS
jgi:hypothetical protein